MSKITVTTIAGLTSGGDANTVKIESGDSLNVVSGDLTVDTSTLKVDSSNNRVGMGTASPSRQVMISRSIADGSGELGIVSSDSSASGALGNIHFGNSTDTSLASIRATADGATDSAKLEFNTEKTGAAIETAMRLDSNGRVTKPLQPAFKAVGTTAGYITTTPVQFPSTSLGEGHNVGGHYNTSTHKFTAPVAGRYLFHLHMGIVRMTSNNANCYPYIRVNDAAIAYSYVGHSTATGYATTHITQILELAANDYVNCTFSTSNAQYYGNYQELSFSGYLLG